MPKFSSHLFGLFNLLIAAFVLSQLFCSCATPHKASYFMDASPTIDTVIDASAPYKDAIIKYGDILSLSVVPLDQLGSLYTSPVSGGVGYSTQAAQLSPSSSASEFTVDKNGMVEFPIIGQIKISGLTIDEAKDVIRQKYAIFYKTFTVNLTYLNHKFTILGEVTKPGSFNMPGNQITIYDGLGMAGDITIFGKKDNVILVRDSTGNKKHMVRLDLNSKKILTSPYYYLRENDMVYVEPNKAKLITTDAYRIRNIGLVTTALGFVLVVLFRTRLL